MSIPTTTASRAVSDAGRPEELAPLTWIDRLALAAGLHLILWSAGHAQRSVRSARRLEAQLAQHRATRDAMLAGAIFGLH